jgi:hypothetical protein
VPLRVFNNNPWLEETRVEVTWPCSQLQRLTGVFIYSLVGWKKIRNQQSMMIPHYAVLFVHSHSKIISLTKFLIV